MTLLELFLEYGNPSQTYSDEVVARFYSDVDDGSFFTEAMGEMKDEDRKTAGRLIFDVTSRSLANQLIGKIVVDQLKEYARLYLQRMHDELADEIHHRQMEAATAASNELKADAAMDSGDAQGSMP